MNDSLFAMAKIIDRNSKKIHGLGVVKLGLFGSYVRNEQNPESDLDFLVEFDPIKKNFDSYFALAELLEKIFEKHVDLLTIESLSPYIGPHILKEVQYFEIPA